MAGPLAGIRILDLSRILAGPSATQLLGDLGAEVIKVERPGQGDDTRKWGPPFLKDEAGRDTEESAYYVSCNRSKRSLTLDIAKPEGQALARRLIAESDVVIENFKAGDLQGARDDLDWLSLKPDRIVRQSERFDLYDQEFERLKAAGRVYACYETPDELELRRKVLLGRGLPPVYERKDPHEPSPEGRAPHWRFRLDHDRPIEWNDLIRGPQRFDPKLLSDPVVRRADGNFDIIAAPRAKPGNWLPTGGVERYQLVLRLYDTAVGVSTKAGREVPMTSVSTRGCP